MKPIIICILFLAVLIAASTSDYKDATESDKRYCKMVKDGVWPDYKGVYDGLCRGVE